MSLEVRSITPEDIDLYKSMRLEMIEEHPDKFVVDVEYFRAMTDDDWSQNTLAYVGREDKDRLFVFDENIAVGIVGINSTSNSYADSLMEIEHIYVPKNKQGRGIGRILMDCSIESSLRMGHEKVGLSVARSNINAMSWYQRLGFRVVGEYGLLEWYMLKEQQ